MERYTIRIERAKKCNLYYIEDTESKEHLYNNQITTVFDKKTADLICNSLNLWAELRALRWGAAQKKMIEIIRKYVPIK